MNRDSDILIIGGGMAGLSAGCYAQMNGWKTHIVEHHQELGGLCTAWQRDQYLIDGCIHWLMGAGPGGMFRTIYEELGVTREVELDTIDVFHRYESPAHDEIVELGRDLGRYRTDLIGLSRDDTEEIDRLLEATERAQQLRMPVDRPPELATVFDRLRTLWSSRKMASALLHFRGSVGSWCNRQLQGRALRQYMSAFVAPEMPVIILPVLLQQIADGQMARPVGGSGAFRDAIVRRYRELGGQVTLQATVDEILVEDDRAIGVRLADGTELRSDAVISTSGAHETLLRLLGGRYVDRSTQKRLDEWPTFDPIVLFSAGVDMSLDEFPGVLLLLQDKPLIIGDRASDVLYMRIYNRDPSFAPAGQCVVQTMLPTRYDWWALRGSDYEGEKMRIAEQILGRMNERVPGLRDAVRMTDVATPLTYWRYSRSWHGAYEGWMPTPETFRHHVPKTVNGLSGLLMAGQWVEPGGGVPPSLASGRQAVQLLCRDTGRPFRTLAPPPVRFAA